MVNYTIFIYITVNIIVSLYFVNIQKCYYYYYYYYFCHIQQQPPLFFTDFGALAMTPNFTPFPSREGS